MLFPPQEAHSLATGHWVASDSRAKQGRRRAARPRPRPLSPPACWVLGFVSHAAPSPRAPLPACVSVMSRESRVRSQPVDTGGGGVAASRAGAQLSTAPPSPLLFPLQTRHPAPSSPCSSTPTGRTLLVCGAFRGPPPSLSSGRTAPGSRVSCPCDAPIGAWTQTSPSARGYGLGSLAAQSQLQGPWEGLGGCLEDASLGPCGPCWLCPQAEPPDPGGQG